MPLRQPDKSLSIFDQFSLRGKVCLVTGGARGIGLEVVRGFAEAGADVVFIYRTNQDALETASRLSKETGRRIQAVKADVTDRSDIARAVEKVASDFGRLDVVVANAGVCQQVNSLDYTEEMWRWEYGVNVEGVMWTAQAAGKIFKSQGFGSLIITASVSSVLVNVPQPQTAYNSSKAAAAHIAKNLAVEWIDFARVNSVSPGYVGTNMTLSQPQQIQESWMSLVPAKRMADPKELKGLYVFLASDASSYVTGANIIIDGAYSIP